MYLSLSIYIYIHVILCVYIYIYIYIYMWRCYGIRRPPEGGIRKGGSRRQISYIYIYIYIYIYVSVGSGSCQSTGLVKPPPISPRPSWSSRTSRSPRTTGTSSTPSSTSWSSRATCRTSRSTCSSSLSPLRGPRSRVILGHNKMPPPEFIPSAGKKHGISTSGISPVQQESRFKT